MNNDTTLSLPIVQPFVAERYGYRVESVIQGEFAVVALTVPSGETFDLSVDDARALSAFLVDAARGVEEHAPVPFIVADDLLRAV